MIRQAPHLKKSSSSKWGRPSVETVLQTSVVIGINIGIVFANANDFDIHIDGCYQDYTTGTSKFTSESFGAV